MPRKFTPSSQESNQNRHYLLFSPQLKAVVGLILLTVLAAILLGGYKLGLFR